MNVNTINGIIARYLGPKIGKNTATVAGLSIYARWHLAQPESIQTYLPEHLWARPVYEVTFPPSVLNAPYSLRNDDPVTLNIAGQGTGYSCVVRRIEPQDFGGKLGCVVALCVVEAGG